MSPGRPRARLNIPVIFSGSEIMLTYAHYMWCTYAFAYTHTQLYGTRFANLAQIYVRPGERGDDATKPAPATSVQLSHKSSQILSTSSCTREKKNRRRRRRQPPSISTHTHTHSTFHEYQHSFYLIKLIDRNRTQQKGVYQTERVLSFFSPQPRFNTLE